MVLQIDVLEKIKDANVVPTEFWFLATLILTSILIIFLGVVTNHIKSFLKDDKEYKAITTDAIREIKEAVLIIRKEQEYDRREINENSNDIRELKKRRRN